MCTIIYLMLQSLSRRRRYVAAAAVNGKVYVIGGYDGQARLNAVECLDLSAEEPSWHSVAPMTQRRGLAGVTVYKGEVIFFGNTSNSCYLVERSMPYTIKLPV